MLRSTFLELILWRVQISIEKTTSNIFLSMTASTNIIIYFYSNIKTVRERSLKNKNIFIPWMHSFSFSYLSLDYLRVHEHIIIIGDPPETYRRPTCLIGDLKLPHWRPTCLIGDPSETSMCYIRDRHAWSETHRRPRHASSETNMPDWRTIKDFDMLHWRPTCLIGDPLKTSTSFIGDQHAWSDTSAC